MARIQVFTRCSPGLHEGGTYTSERESGQRPRCEQEHDSSPGSAGALPDGREFCYNPPPWSQLTSASDPRVRGRIPGPARAPSVLIAETPGVAGKLRGKVVAVRPSGDLVSDLTREQFRGVSHHQKLAVTCDGHSTAGVFDS
ncbi:MAG TPA: hypothetical protein VIY86_04130, partial [Pirellulaceae bacterium]